MVKNYLLIIIYNDKCKIHDYFMEMASSSLIRNFSCKEEHFVVSLTTLAVICSKPETLDRKP